ncbi:zinc-dependent hydrolase [Palaeococcus pacificus DY20341]|uniref:Zinc-dependent hydrolase n=1 Tax=Palaeococcus pacificus DY20341 TaxID=1343739 RepID=A0A075LUW8_9EURY|nr:MBL fold metallo-hydrolase [Palaeococcus pacificus]AIF69931.1 zinc-dependent hydrolase [Palaeococcus pacificus DY20341]
MALRELGDGLYLYPGSPSTMIKVHEGKAVLIDVGHGSGRHKDLKREVKKLGVEIEALMATHGHADHISVVPKLEKPLFIHRFEFSVAESPLNRELLTFGSKAPKGFLVYQFPQEVKAHVIFEWDDELFGLRTIKLDGHSPGMTGFLDKDNGVLYAGDSFFGEKIIQAVGAPYLIDPELFKASIKELHNYANKGFTIIPSHGRMVRGGEALEVLDFNLKRVEEIEEKILELLEKPMSISELSYSLAKAFDAKITPQTLALNQVPIRAFIAELYNRELIEAVIEKDLKWKVRG